nr:unnamed protein product [Callosobruchus chinensis]
MYWKAYPYTLASTDPRPNSPGFSCLGTCKRTGVRNGSADLRNFDSAF